VPRQQNHRGCDGRANLRGARHAAIPPELRQGRDEIAHALAGILPGLVIDTDIRGILHAHTDRSDGVDTVETMAEATLARGYQYFGFADHSKSAHYAGGLSPEEVANQQVEADRLNKKYGRPFRIFKGIESDILADGSLDFRAEVPDTFDLSGKRPRTLQARPRDANGAHHPRGS
jgi:DNA polymerase (family 10)